MAIPKYLVDFSTVKDVALNQIFGNEHLSPLEIVNIMWDFIIKNDLIYEYKEQESDVYYVHRNSGNKVFVKGGDFFEKQGGLTDPWGKSWRKVHASSIEDARAIGEEILPCV